MLVSYDPNDSMLWWYRGLLALAAGNINQANFYVSKLKGTPNDLYLYIAYPEILINNGRLDEAEPFLRVGAKRYLDTVI